MKLLFAYTAKALMNAGTPFPYPEYAAWKQIGSTPFVFHQAYANIFGDWGDELALQLAYAHMFARNGDLLGRLSADEVLTWGWRYRGTYSTASSAPLAGLLVNDPRQAVYPILWNDGPASPSVSVDIFFEVTVDPVARTATGYVNGRKTRTLPIPDTVLWNEVNLGYFLPLANAGVYRSGNHFYAAVFKKSEGTTHLTSWECDTLTEVSSELQAGAVGESWKSVVYSIPGPMLAVAGDMKALNPQTWSTLLTELSDGVTTVPLAIPSIGAGHRNVEFGNNTVAKSTASLTPSKLATQLTLKLKAQPPQE